MADVDKSISLFFVWPNFTQTFSISSKKKKQSAVKAKLVELGSGTAGYIDDELPDYVMIMVANKRSKEQMTTDLSLFLGKNTDVFVGWLHQVLEKLQEVSLPATCKYFLFSKFQSIFRHFISTNSQSFSEFLCHIAAIVAGAGTQPKTKRKLSESTDKRDKKAKDKKRTGKDKSPARSTTPPIRNPPTSITDVIADDLIQKANQVIEPPLSVKKAERNNGTNDGFDIPTISEMAKKAPFNARKEITELAELQKRIEEAKRQLNLNGDSEDEDFINFRTDRNDLDGEMDSNSRDSNSNEKANANRKDTDLDENGKKQHSRIVFDDKPDNKNDDSNASKRSVLNRLGNRNQSEEIEKDKSERNENIISLSAHRRVEQAIYVAPAQRSLSSLVTRNEKSASSSRPTIRERSRERLGRDLRSERITREPSLRSREPKEPIDLREKFRQRNRDLDLRQTRTENRSEDFADKRPRNPSALGRKEKTPPKPTLASRIGSKVIVTNNSDEYSEEEIQVPLNSVIKVKPRPIIPQSKQASKNLLLRAVAEAQKSTALAKPNTMEVKANARNKTELYTKSYRKNLNKDNIVVEVATNRAKTVIDVDEIGAASEDDEYVPTPVPQDDPLVYIPQVIKDTLHDR